MKAVYPGTFDPITLGHLDILQRATRIFDEIVIGVSTHPGKHSLFSLEERAAMVEKAVAGMRGVSVKTFEGLLVDFAREQEAKVIVRGLREQTDFPEEFQRTTANRILNADIETVFIMTGKKYFYLNSSLVKEIAHFGGNVADFVPKHVQEALKEKQGETL